MNAGAIIQWHRCAPFSRIRSLLSASSLFLFAGCYATTYAPQYSETAFRSLQLGDSEQHVLQTLGQPLARIPTTPYTEWVYSDQDQTGFSQHGKATLRGTFTLFKFGTNGALRHVSGQIVRGSGEIVTGNGQNHLRLVAPDIKGLLGTTTETVQARFGVPESIYEYRSTVILQYSKSPTGGSYRKREIGIDSRGRVAHIWSEVYED